MEEQLIEYLSVCASFYRNFNQPERRMSSFFTVLRTNRHTWKANFLCIIMTIQKHINQRENLTLIHTTIIVYGNGRDLYRILI